MPQGFILNYKPNAKQYFVDGRAVNIIGQINRLAPLMPVAKVRYVVEKHIKHTGMKQMVVNVPHINEQIEKNVYEYKTLNGIELDDLLDLENGEPIYRQYVLIDEKDIRIIKDNKSSKDILTKLD